eukprot:SAG11_NODE_4026_length_2099_cov_2.975500_2_plen_122_part_00
MRTTALLSLLSLWMTNVRGGRLITAAATGSELVSTAGSSCKPKEKEASAHPGDSAVNGDFLPIFVFISLPECGGSGSHFYRTSGSAALDSLEPFEEQHFISRCAVAARRSALPIFVHFLSE